MEDISAGASAEIEGAGSLSFTGFKHQDSVITREDAGTSVHPAGEDAEFVCLYFDIMNSGSEAVNYASDAQVIADQTEGKKYGGWMYPADDSSGEMVFVTNSENEEAFAVKPSEAGHYVAGVTLPKEGMQGSQEVTFKIRIGEAKIAVDLTDDQSEPEMEPAAVEDSVQAENTDSERTELRTEVQTEVQTDTSVQEKKEAEDPYQGLLNDQVHYFSYNEFDFILNFSEKYYNFFIDDHTEDYQVSLDRMGMSAQEAQELLDQDGCELLAFPVGATKDSFHFKVFFSCWTYDEQDTSSDAFQDYCLNSGECFSEKCENLALLGTEPKGAYTYDVYSCNIGDRYYYSFLTLCDGVVLKMDCLYRDEQGEKEGLEAIDYILSRTINSQYNETGNYYRENGPGRDQQVWMDDNNPKNGCFINGMVWIDYDGQHWGLMDETGVVVYSVGIYELIETHEMGEDGLTYIKTNSNDQEEFVAIDRDGEEKFRLTCPEDTELEILGHGNHTFLVYERTAGFSEVNESLYVLDEDGNQIGDSVSVSSGVYSCEFLDPDLYILTFKDERYNSAENYYVYNISTGELFKLSGSTRIHMPFYNGESFINVYLDGEDLYGKITHEDLQSPQAWETWLETKAQPGQHDYDIYDYREEGMFLNDYPYNRESDRIYDYDGNEVSLDMFPANVEVNYYGDYSGGYKMLLLTGADGHSYVTVIDRAGNQLYEPGKVEEDRDGKEQSHGYVLYRASGKYHLIDRTGAEEILDIDDYGNVTRFDGKYLYCRDIIYDVIQKRFVFAYYRDGIPSVDYSDNADTYEPEKIYSDISNFNITGKWKNTGSDDYGQAQSGAIVVFDGKNCNFYSPNDTYAFYKEGDHYRLDCTSMLFADTVSFVVNTVDQGHIDIEFSGGIVELTRVE